MHNGRFNCVMEIHSFAPQLLDVSQKSTQVPNYSGSYTLLAFWHIACLIKSEFHLQSYFEFGVRYGEALPGANHS